MHSWNQTPDAATTITRTFPVAGALCRPTVPPPHVHCRTQYDASQHPRRRNSHPHPSLRPQFCLVPRSGGSRGLLSVFGAHDKHSKQFSWIQEKRGRESHPHMQRAAAYVACLVTYFMPTTSQASVWGCPYRMPATEHNLSHLACKIPPRLKASLSSVTGPYMSPSTYIADICINLYHLTFDSER
jgi:hypothetical protein